MSRFLQWHCWCDNVFGTNFKWFLPLVKRNSILVLDNMTHACRLFLKVRQCWLWRVKQYMCTICVSAQKPDKRKEVHCI